MYNQQRRFTPIYRFAVFEIKWTFRCDFYFSKEVDFYFNCSKARCKKYHKLSRNLSMTLPFSNPVILRTFSHDNNVCARKIPAVKSSRTEEHIRCRRRSMNFCLSLWYASRVPIGFRTQL